MTSRTGLAAAALLLEMPRHMRGKARDATTIEYAAWFVRSGGRPLNVGRRFCVLPRLLSSSLEGD